MTLAAPMLSQWALRVGPPELFALTLLGMFMIAVMAQGSVFKGVLAAGFGILIAAIGMDSLTGTQRFTFGVPDLMDGIGIVPLAVGMFGLGEILVDAETRFRRNSVGKTGSVWPKLSELMATRWAILRASVVGFFVGIIPGGGGAMASIVAYGAERKVSKHPEKFGHGAMDGLAATETADNAASNSSFIPLLTLGIPPNPVIALIAGALIIQGITPGPQLIERHPDVFWGVIASMYIGVVALLILNLPLVGLFTQILRVPSAILVSVVLAIAVCGVYSVRNNLFDVWLMFIFGAVGYCFKKLHIPPGPLVLGFILAPIMETELRRSLLMSGGNFGIFFERPITLVVIIAIGFMTVSLIIPWKLIRSRIVPARPDK
jgi:putative tricarboxylic transport membrane protein